MKKRTDSATSRANQIIFSGLIRRHEISLIKAAQLIEATTARPCGYRTVKSWMANPELVKSARPCPNWAVAALKKALEGNLSK